MQIFLLFSLGLIVAARSNEEARIEFCKNSHQRCLENCLQLGLQTIEVDDGYVCISKNYSKCNVTDNDDRICSDGTVCSNLNNLLKPEHSICLPFGSEILDIQLFKRDEGQTCLSNEMCTTSTCNKNGTCTIAPANPNEIQSHFNMK